MHCLLAIQLLAAIGPGAEGELVVRSEDGSLRALVASAEDGSRGVRVERVEDGAATPLWSAPYPPAAEDEHHLLVAGPDGAALLAHVRPFLDDAALAPVSLHGRAESGQGGELRAWSASDLHLAPDELPELPPGRRWLAQEDGAARAWRVEQPWGTELGLALLFVDGRAKQVDLQSGSVRAGEAAERVTWSPGPVELESPELPYVRGLECAELVAPGAALAVVLRGDFPTPGWSLEGIALHGRRLGSTPGQGSRPGAIELSLEPLARRPPADSLTAAVLEAFERRVELRGLPPGDYVLRSYTRADRELAARRFTVLEPDLVLSLHTSGGFAGMDRVLEVHADGWARRGGGRPLHRALGAFRLAPEELEALRELLERLPARSFTEHFAGGADIVAHELVWLRGGAAFRARVDDMTAEGALGELLRLAQGLGDE